MFRNADSKWRTAPHYKIANCVIEKSMSTVLAATTCYLYNTSNFLIHNRSLTSDVYHTRLCKDKNEYNSIQKLETSNAVRRFDWLYFTVVREPIDRFFSGFVDKCLRDTRRLAASDRCFGCKDNVECVIHKLHNRALAFSNGKTKAVSYDDIHFFPQNWHCNMKSTYNKLKFIHFVSPSSEEYQDNLKQMLHYFQEQNVEEEKLRYINNSLTGAVHRRSLDTMSDGFDYSADSLYGNTLEIDDLQSAIDETSEVDAAVRAVDKWDDNLEHYHFWELLGSGSFGDVFKVFNEKEGKTCAVKMMRTPREMVTYQKREIRAMGILRHPNIVELHCACIVQKSILIMVMPLLWSMQDVIQEAKNSKSYQEYDCISESTCRLLIKQLVTGLAFMHSKKFAHRDLKVANLLLDNHGVLKIADFGICHELDMADSADLATMKSPCGSEVYMAPEVYFMFHATSFEEKFCPYSIRAETWSIGVIFLEMRVGKVPFSHLLMERKKRQLLRNALKLFLESSRFDFNLLYPNGERHEELLFSQPALEFLRKCLYCKPRQRPTAQMLLDSDPWLEPVEEMETEKIRRELLRTQFLESVEVMDQYGNMESMGEFDIVTNSLKHDQVLITVMIRSPSMQYVPRIIRFVVELKKKLFCKRAAEKVARAKMLPYSRRKVICGRDFVRLTMKIVAACRRFSKSDNVKHVYETFSLTGLHRPPNHATLEGMAVVLVNKSLKRSEKVMTSRIPGIELKSGELDKKDFKMLKQQALKDIAAFSEDLSSYASTETIESVPSSSAVDESSLSTRYDSVETSGTILKKRYLKLPFGRHKIYRLDEAKTKYRSPK
ncbi:unnamed protein product [Bursaphelenchus okinawaensis]|uniref:Protein kinase domain-containing protein n=1 Tax=Bursaphelenchus okinawaensis TaxID=465554 RepID=A0A811LJN8_9BILA|nr:unnamed protein product [Bursaphelenchus okinawaensis]CAG9124896.1 unnamed protein product [Bursaphelenchus okinawaensis]